MDLALLSCLKVFLENWLNGDIYKAFFKSVRFVVFLKITAHDCLLVCSRAASIGGRPDNPVAFFSVDSDW